MGFLSGNFIRRTGLLMYAVLMCSLLHAQSLAPVQGSLSGTVLNAQTGTPLVGAKITAGSFSVLSVTGGQYQISGIPAGNYPVTCQKTGFVSFSQPSVTIPASGTVTLNITLYENTPPPGLVTAFLDTTYNRVPVTWTPPSDLCELLYDDGIKEDFTVWATQGNMNGVRFSPLGYPAEVTGGKIHIGDSSDYPPGSSPLVPFQVAVYDASGPMNMPGILIGGPFDVIPAGFGWVSFNFATPVSLTAGQFYLVMIQGGNAPNAAGLAIDNTIPQLRSVSRYANGGAPWVPGNGNFLIRAIVKSPGGPGLMEHIPGAIQQYQVFRLRQGEEMNPLVWNDLGFSQGFQLTDSSWLSLPCGPYRWGVKALYSGNRSSQTTFSNIVPKCWTVPVTIAADLSCDSATTWGVSVSMVNLVYPDTAYQAIADSSGLHTFPQVWKGSYQVSVQRFGYQSQTQNVSISVADTLSYYLLQKKTPPRNLNIQNQSLLATWSPPVFSDTVFAEDWNSGSFSTNGWTLEGGSNWLLSLTTGNPAPAALFYWSPQALNYDQALTGRQLSGVHSARLNLVYDITLDNFGTTTVNEMAVEIWSESQWLLLKNYTNSSGDIPWTRESIDISEYTSSQFRIRFRAHGEDSYDINGWYLDNILVLASETPEGISNCVLGYNFYLNSSLVAFVQDTSLFIPGNLVTYGTQYEACVLAAYGSGFSELTCDTFTSWFLWPPDSLTVAAVEHSAFLQWQKPQAPADTGGFITPAGLLGYEIVRNDTLIQTILQPDQLEWYDMELEPGTYTYFIKAIYDLTPYGYPGQNATSAPEGPATVQIIFGFPLPFLEPWDHGSFAFNEWRFYPDQGNWSMDASAGNPSPSAKFSWEPPVPAYSFALESPALDASPFQCATIWLDFDLKLTDMNQSGEEKLFVEVFYDQTWHLKTLFANDGSFDWTTIHLDLRAVQGKAFRIRFRAAGANSIDLSSWRIDNIHVYGECYPARDLTGDVQGYNVLLSWFPPDCNGGASILQEGFEQAEFPPSGWNLLISDTSNTWTHLPATSSIGVHSGNWAAGLNSGYAAQDEWLIANNILVNGDLKFWSYAYQGSTTGEHFYVKISTDGGSNWVRLMDLSALPPYPSVSGYNAWETPYLIDLSEYEGQLADFAWHATDGTGAGLWHVWAIDDCQMVSGDKPESLAGYNVFRKGEGGGSFVRVNGEPLPDTNFTDTGLAAGQYEYYIRAVYPECPDVATSDTLQVDVITRVSNPEMPAIRVWPNPVVDKLHVSSVIEITQIMVSTITGQVIQTLVIPSDNNVTVDLSGIRQGIYQIRILTMTTSDVFNIVKFK